MNANTHSPEGVADLEDKLQLNHLRPLRNAEVSLFLKSMQSLNTVCFRGHTKVRKSGEDAWKIRDRGTGHWGPNVYPGVAAHRTGRTGSGFIREQQVQAGDLA